MDFLMQLDQNFIDVNLLLFIQEYLRFDWMTPIWKLITWLGDAGWFWIALSVILLIPKKTRKIGATALISLLIGALITNVALKNLVARTRPYEVIDGLILLVDPQHDFSFPSGHSCASFAAAMVFYKMLPHKYGIPAVVLATLIALSRLYVGVHYPSDVAAGILIGIFSAWAAWKIVEKMWIKRKTKTMM